MNLLFFKAIFIKYWLIAATIFLIGISVVLSFNQLFFLQFVDEEDNFILGHFLLGGQKLYSDLFSHHQPYAYLISALLQFIFQPENIFELVQLHRFFMISWSIGWILFLVWRFKQKVLIPFFAFELIKLYALGNLFLSEALAVYPLFYLILTLLYQSQKIREYLWLGFVVGFLALLLAPLWPLLALYTVILFFMTQTRKQSLIYFIFGLVSAIILVLPFIDLSYYFRNIFYINFKYYIPQSAEEKMPLAIIKAFFSPVIILFGPSKIDTLGLILKMVWPVFVIGLVGLLWKKRYYQFGLILVFLMLANIRYYAPYLEYRAGFHTLVWLGLFLVFSYYSYSLFYHSFKKILIRRIMTALMIFLLGGMYLFSPIFFILQDQKENFTVNYGQKVVYGDAIRAIRSPDDTLFVIPDEWLLYFQGDIKNHNKMVNYYSWMSLVWELHDPVIEKFKSNPPTFFYCDCSEETVYLYSDQHKQMIRNGAKTPLWILNKKFSSLNDREKTDLRSLNFQLE